MRRLLRRLWYIVRQRRMQADLADEMAFHREMNAKTGGSSTFGSTALAADDSHDVWISPWVQDIWQDARFAARLLIKDPRFTLAAVLALALGIAVNTTIFTIVNTAVLRELPFDDPDRLVSVGTWDARGRESGVSYQDYTDWRAMTRTTFTGLAAYTGSAVNLSGDKNAPERVQGAFISADTLRLLRIEPGLGRNFTADDDRVGASPVVLIGHRLWQRRYRSDRSILGRTVLINDTPSTVIGVTPPDFRFPFSDEIWQPLALAPGIASAKRDVRSLNVLGRLADSRSIDGARADLEVVAARLSIAHPDTNKAIRSRIAAMGPPKPPTGVLMALMGSVIFVLLIACANVANLLLARSAVRTKELAIRASLGATRWRIIRQLLIECGILAAFSGVLGLALSVYGVKFLGTAFDGRQAGAPASAAVTPYWVNLSMNEPVFLFLGSACLLSTLLSGLVPALHVSRLNPNDVLKDGGRNGGTTRRAHRLSSAFMIGQVALTLVLLTGAGLMLRGFVSLYREDRVINTAGLVTGRLSLPPQKYATPEARRQFFERLHHRFSSTPLRVAMVSDIPFSFVNATRQMAVAGQAEQPVDEWPTVSHFYVDETYFDVLGVQMISGRPFQPADARPGQEGVIVNQRLADMYFVAGDALGGRIRLTTQGGAVPQPVWLTIVGVAPTIPQSVGSPEQDRPAVFVPLLGQTTPAVVSLMIRSHSDAAGAVSIVRDEIRAIDPSLPLYWVQTMEQVFADARVPLRLIGGWFGTLAVIALVLATIGVYAVTGHLVAQRTQEIGVRVALGAEKHQVVWLFLRRTIMQLVAGVAIGMAGALAVGQLLQTLIAGVSPRDPLTLVLVTLLLSGVAIVATLLPARRATRIEPLVALRNE
jgi:putative ABC transport system permease protein